MKRIGLALLVVYTLLLLATPGASAKMDSRAAWTAPAPPRRPLQACRSAQFAPC